MDRREERKKENREGTKTEEGKQGAGRKLQDRLCGYWFDRPLLSLTTAVTTETETERL